MPRTSLQRLVNTTLVKNIRLGVTATARTGSPYNVTTGRDDNGDTVFNDRPSGVGAQQRRRRRACGIVAARVSYAFGFGQRSAGGTIRAARR